MSFREEPPQKDSARYPVYCESTIVTCELLNIESQTSLGVVAAASTLDLSGECL